MSNGLSIERRGMRSEPMALVGLGPSFGQRDWTRRPHYKVEVQGPNGPRDPMPYNNDFVYF